MVTLFLHAVTACTQLLLQSFHLPDGQVQAGLTRAAQIHAHTREIAFHTHMMEIVDQ